MPRHALARRASRLAEVAQPPTGYRLQPIRLQPVDVLAPAQLDGDQACLLQHSQVPRDRRPGMLEPRRDGPGCHLAAAGMEDNENGSPRLVRERAEYGVEVVELCQSACPACHPLSATRS